MLWDRSRILPVETPPDRRRALLLWLAPDALPRSVVQACDLAAIDVAQVADLETCLGDIALRKPDMLVYDLAHTAGFADFEDRVAQHRTTATLPMLAYHATANDTALRALCAKTTATDAFLTIRGLLRRARPSALKGTRRAVPFTLDEPRFKLLHGTACAEISKTDLCILGPFFDVADVVFDRRSLARLAFGTTGASTNSRSIDAHVSRVRRHVRTQLGIDPLRSVRGIGYTLADS